jgi:nitrite reductase (NO-forming)
MKYSSAVSIAIIFFVLVILTSLFFSSLIQKQPAHAQADGNISHKEFTLIAEDAHLDMDSKAPGKNVTVWTYNGTVPGPAIRVTEGDIVTIHFINNASTDHTIHFHGDHADVNDGVSPQIKAGGGRYNYNFTAEPSGLLLYHCHMMPATSTHIRMGMYGAIIVDPKEKQNQLQPAREFLLVMSEYDPLDPTKFEPAYYPINGYSNVYFDHPLEAKYNELVRFYVINIGVTIPYSFHLHSATFKAYPSGLTANTPINAQSFSIGPGDAAIIEVKWKYPGMYLFHSHGIQEEKGNMGNITYTGTATPLTKSISMIDWQYQLQKQLQKPVIIPYPPPSPRNPQNMSSNNTISIVVNASIPNRELYYAPSPSTVSNGTRVNWTNDDATLHTVTSTNSPPTFDSGYMSPGKKFSFIFGSPGIYNYFCKIHPFMRGQVIVK